MAKEKKAKHEAPKQYIPLEGIAGKLVLFLTIGMVIDALSFVMTGASLVLLPAGLTEEDPRMMVKLLSDGILGLGQFVIFILCTVAFCKWMYRAYANLEWFGLQGVKTSPKLAVVYWFVPFFNMWKPYQCVREMWQGSDRRATAEGWQSIKPPPEFGAWWTFWLLNNFIGNAMFRVQLKTGDEGSQLLDGMEIASTFTAVVGAFLVIRIIKAITERQHQKMHAMATAPEAKNQERA